MAVEAAVVVAAEAAAVVVAAVEAVAAAGPVAGETAAAAAVGSGERVAELCHLLAPVAATERIRLRPAGPSWRQCFDPGKIRLQMEAEHAVVGAIAVVARAVPSLGTGAGTAYLETAES